MAKQSSGEDNSFYTHKELCEKMIIMEQKIHDLESENKDLKHKTYELWSEMEKGKEREQYKEKLFFEWMLSASLMWDNMMGWQVT